MKTFLFIAAAASLLGRAVPAQGSKDGMGLSRAAAHYVTSTLLPMKVIALDTAPPWGDGRKAQQGVLRGADADSIAYELGGSKLGKSADFLQCPTGPRSCQFAGVDAVVALGSPIVRGDSGFVRVRIQRKSSVARRPLLVTDGVLRFIRSGASWAFVAYDNHSIS